ncbi:truncated basic helix-loop-helix protein A-like [Vigna umbellata]|uniref:truncated basic helix-loop-helix protein A-like n=1 Tax=Vigna umbellata TaxID=87088 RepID=UPI001F5E6E7B|nr:truncated basic helix-loop-helix protein A-like [Vigna umbellata]XP_047157065.1 truncated basic helix-loop-helix protein A-like [Vigna umbellata]
MAAPLGNKLQSMLQAAVQSVHWTYSLFWQLCPQQVILVWGDGYYNGAIKTRKTVQPMEVSAEEASLQRSQQLRELYESLSAGETNPPTRRPCAALSPEDLTESEWFYLMCVSFSFPPGVGLPGKAYARRQHVWLTGANEVDSKTFSRAILAKSARIQTVVCIPLLDGVVEFGTTDKIQEDLNFIHHVKTFFAEHHHPLPPKPALSEHSTSNPISSSDHIPAVMYTVADPPAADPSLNDEMDEDEEEEDEEEEEEEEEGAESASEDETRDRIARRVTTPEMEDVTRAEPSELMQLELPEDIRVGSPNDGSNNLDSDFHLLAVSQGGNAAGQAESSVRWGPSEEALQVQLPASAPHLLDDLTQEDNHYSETVSNILQNQSSRWPTSPTSVGYITYSTHSAFTKWSSRASHLFHPAVDGPSQWLLKYILFTVPYLHAKNPADTSPQTAADPKLRGKGTPQDELSANHVLAERRRREKLNERFVILRSLVPFVTKMDKASILGDTIEYVKQLRRKIQELEARNRHTEAEHRSKLPEVTVQRTSSNSSKEQQRSGVTVMEKRKVRIVEGVAAKATAVEAETATSVQVSIIESDALLEIECVHREGLLLDVMQMLREVRIEVIGVQSSISNGVFMAELRAKVKEHANGKKVSIVEVKKALNQIIPHPLH